MPEQALDLQDRRLLLVPDQQAAGVAREQGCRADRRAAVDGQSLVRASHQRRPSVVPRTTRSLGNTTTRGLTSLPRTRSRSTCAARRPISSLATRTVVRGGVVRAFCSLKDTATTERS